MSKIRAIHPFGPPVGKWTVHATVPATIARAHKRLKEDAERQQAAEVEANAVLAKREIRGRKP